MARTASKSCPARDAYQEVTDRIVAALESGTVPWAKPWIAGAAPSNAVTGKAYRGINPLLLALTAAEQGYGDPRWLTFRQAQAKGGSVRKGEHGTAILFWKFIEGAEDAEGRVSRIPLARVYTVFNVAQCDGLTLEPLATAEAPVDVVAAAEGIVAAYVATGPSFDHKGGESAYYSPAVDAVHLPARETFTSTAGYYSTAFHELVHSTGHSTRLDRFAKEAPAHFGSPVYGREELVAELGAAFLCQSVGIVNEEQSAAYLASWLTAIKGDKRLVITAAGQAAKAVDVIIGAGAEDEAADDE